MVMTVVKITEIICHFDRRLSLEGNGSIVDLTSQTALVLNYLNILHYKLRIILNVYLD